MAIQYFELERGITLAIFYFYKDSDGTSKEIISLKQVCWEKLVARNADSCTVSYGKNVSIYEVSELISFACLIASHCNMHILHNAAKHRQKLSFYTEMSVIKLFNELLSSAKELDEFKYIFIFLETEYYVSMFLLPSSACLLLWLDYLKTV